MLIDVCLAFLLLGMVAAMILFIWFDTTAFVEYTSLFDCNLAYVDEYKIATKDDPATSYPDYMNTWHSNFLTRLLGCPKCLSVWISALINIPVFFVLQLTLIYLVWILFPISVLITSYFALFLYYNLVKLMKQ